MAFLRHGLALLVICLLALAKKDNVKKLRGKERLDAPSAQIIGGYNATKGQFPWQVMIRFDDEFYCGGVLIGPQWVITAAWCVDPLEEGYTVRIGSTFREDFEPGRVEMHIPLENIFVNSNYSSEADEPYLNGNIALIKLPIALVLPTKPTEISYIKAAQLPKKGEKSNYQDFNGTVSGWGYANGTDEGSDTYQLKYTNLTIVSPIQCSLKYKNYSPDQHFCGQDSDTDAACWYDEGGPMVIREKNNAYTLVGVISYPACSKNFTLFSRVTYFSTWIRNIMKIK